MLKTRLIPILLVQNKGVVKGINFKNHKYVGDPINAVKLFNEKEVDELVILDISATENETGPNFDLIVDIASEAFMPLGYGGGINSVEQLESLFQIGIEKVVINTAAFFNPELVREASKAAGSQSVVVSIDVRKGIFGKYEVYVGNGKIRTKIQPVEYARKMEQLGAGELIVCAINQEGTGTGYDIDLLRDVSSVVSIPVVGAGGAANLEHVSSLIRSTNISAAAAGDMFIFHGKHKAVLISYPEYSEMVKWMGENVT